MRHLILSFILLLPSLLSSASYAESELEPEVKRIAVLQLSNRLEMSPAEIEYLTGIVRLEAAKRLPSSYLVMTQENILSLLPPEKTLEDCQGECEVDIGRLLGARYIITGEVLRFGSSLRLTLRLHDTSSGRLISSEIAKGKQIEDLEEPTARSIQTLLQSLNPNGALKARAEEAIQALEQGKSAQEARPDTSTLPQAQPRPARAASPPPAPKPPAPQKRAQPKQSKQASEAKPHPRYELQMGFGMPQCIANGDRSCTALNRKTQENALNDFGFQYKLLQLSSLSFATDLRYTFSELSTLESAKHKVATLSIGLVTTFISGLWFGRLQLGAGVQDGEIILAETRRTYLGGAIRVGGEGGVTLGGLSLSMYVQNELIPRQTELCEKVMAGPMTCQSGWTSGVRQLGLRFGLMWGE